MVFPVHLIEYIDIFYQIVSYDKHDISIYLYRRFFFFFLYRYMNLIRL